MALANGPKNPTSCFSQFDFILCRLVCMDREIKCFVNVCERTNEIREGNGSLYEEVSFPEPHSDFIGKIVLHLPCRFWSWVHTSLNYKSSLNLRIFWAGGDTQGLSPTKRRIKHPQGHFTPWVGAQLAQAGCRTSWRRFWELHTKIADLFMTVFNNASALRMVEMPGTSCSSKKSALKESPNPGI